MGPHSPYLTDGHHAGADRRPPWPSTAPRRARRRCLRHHLPAAAGSASPAGNTHAGLALALPILQADLRRLCATGRGRERGTDLKLSAVLPARDCMVGAFSLEEG